MDVLNRLLDTSDFPARWHCGNWTSAHGWLHVLSDIGVFSAYFAIPCILAFFIVRKQDLPFRWIFLLFGAFITACGTTHLMEAAIFWWPAYRLAGLLKLLTAIISWITVVALIPVVPKVLAMRSPEELEGEIALRRGAEAKLQMANEELERRVKERTSELQELARQLADGDRRKNEFLATLAHELRNPLAPLSAGIETLRLAPEEPTRVIAVQEMMERQMRQLVTIVDDLLDVARITRGKLQLRRSRVELASILASAVEASRPMIDAAGLQLDVVIPPEPVTLDADPHRLSQVFSNLLHNAAKNTPAGGRITLQAARQDDEVVVVVADTGRGIPPEMLERVFDMFTQLEAPPEGGASGLGIGLTLVKNLVEMHGGRVAVRSDGPGRGAEFEVRLRVSATQAMDADGPAAQEEPRRRISRRVLVADDNVDAVEALTIVLELEGHEVRTAHDGAETLRACEEWRPDIVLLDLGMPIMDGFAAARAIRASEWGRDVMIVALSGWGQDADRERTREAGFDEHLVKPADPAVLRRLLEGSRKRDP